MISLKYQVQGFFLYQAFVPDVIQPATMVVSYLMNFHKCCTYIATDGLQYFYYYHNCHVDPRGGFDLSNHLDGDTFENSAMLGSDRIEDLGSKEEQQIFISWHVPI